MADDALERILSDVDMSDVSAMVASARATLSATERLVADWSAYTRSVASLRSSSRDDGLKGNNDDVVADGLDGTRLRVTAGQWSRLDVACLVDPEQPTTTRDADVAAFRRYLVASAGTVTTKYGISIFGDVDGFHKRQCFYFCNVCPRCWIEPGNHGNAGHAYRHGRRRACATCVGQ